MSKSKTKKPEGFMSQTEERIATILQTSEDLQEAIKALKSLVYASYKNGLKLQATAKAETSNKFYQAKEYDYEA